MSSNDDIFTCRWKIVFCVFFLICFCPQEAEAFALYHKALDLQKHDKFEESAKAYHELLKTPLLKEVIHSNCLVLEMNNYWIQ